ncbi:MAG: dethiobiotin synthase [Burkholderiales bacterium]
MPINQCKAFFVTGTDTGVGKTVVTCALMQLGTAQGDKVGAMKPVAAGAKKFATGWMNEDVALLRQNINIEIAAGDLNPYLFHEPIAPHIAAARENISIDTNKISASLDNIKRHADWVFVEGAGGFKVPLGNRLDMAELAVALGLPLILVVGMRLGCLNHALLTRDAIGAHGLPLAGWVANTIDPTMPAFDENLAALRQRINAPLLGVVPHLGQPDFAPLKVKTLRLPE